MMLHLVVFMQGCCTVFNACIYTVDHRRHAGLFVETEVAYKAQLRKKLRESDRLIILLF